MQVPKDFLLGTDPQPKDFLLGPDAQERLLNKNVNPNRVKHTLYWALGWGCMHLFICLGFLIVTITNQEKIFRHDVDVVHSTTCWKSQHDLFNVFEPINVSRKKMIAGCIIIFHFLSGFFQTVPFWWYQTWYPKEYAHRIETNGIMYLRFTEYSLSAPVVLIAISLVTGIMDIFTLVFIAVLTMLCMIMGLAVDILRYMIQTATVNDKDKARIWKLIILLHAMGWVAISAPWATILIGFYTGKRNIISTSDSACGSANYSGPLITAEIPGFVEPLLWTECVLFSVFGFVQLLQLYRGSRTFRDADDRTKRNEAIGVWCERAYVGLSFFSKTFLGVMTFGNVLFADDIA
jgi:hypothetical protein